MTITKKYYIMLYNRFKNGECMIIQKYCSKMKRFLVKFEHHETCVLKEDVNEYRAEEEWTKRFLEYVSSNEIVEEDLDE